MGVSKEPGWDVIDRFLGSVSIQPVKNSQLVNISFDSHRPELAAKMANAVAGLYIDYSIESKLGVTQQAKDWLEKQLEDLKRKGVRPKFIYTIPTVQNPTGTILPVERRKEMLRLAAEYGVPIFADDCYCDLIWSGKRPPAIYAMSDRGDVIHIGSLPTGRALLPQVREL